MMKQRFTVEKPRAVVLLMAVRRTVIALCLVAGLPSCSEVGAPPVGSGSDIAIPPEPRVSANAFFPLQVGNEWRYRVNDRDDLWMVKRVLDSSRTGSRVRYNVLETWWDGDVHHYLYSVDSHHLVRAHESRADSVGIVYLRTDALRGAEWASLTYVKERYAREAVPAGTFGPCVSVQRWLGESQIEVYAENVGEIRRSSFGGRSLRLTSASIGGAVYP